MSVCGTLIFRCRSFPDDLPKYESIKQPVLIVQGVEDKTIPRSTAVQARAALHSHLKSIRAAMPGICLNMSTSAQLDMEMDISNMRSIDCRLRID